MACVCACMFMGGADCMKKRGHVSVVCIVFFRKCHTRSNANHIFTRLPAMPRIVYSCIMTFLITTHTRAMVGFSSKTQSAWNDGTQRARSIPTIVGTFCTRLPVLVKHAFLVEPPAGRALFRGGASVGHPLQNG